MTISLTRQLKPCPGNCPFANPGPGVDRDSSPLTLGANSSGTAADLTPSRVKEGAFLKRLLADQGGAENLRLQERLTIADSEFKAPQTECSMQPSARKRLQFPPSNSKMP